MQEKDVPRIRSPTRNHDCINSCSCQSEKEESLPNWTPLKKNWRNWISRNNCRNINLIKPDLIKLKTKLIRFDFKVREKCWHSCLLMVPPFFILFFSYTAVLVALLIFFYFIDFSPPFLWFSNLFVKFY